jgi:phosphotransferase system HPr (HPr) family protein
MISKEVNVINRLGLHARPAIQFVQKANEFKCDIKIVKGERKANAKSISQLIALKVRQNDCIFIEVQGEDEEEAIATLIPLLLSETSDLKNSDSTESAEK